MVHELVCLVLMCGLPGAGKSTLCRSLAAEAARIFPNQQPNSETSDGGQLPNHCGRLLSKQQQQQPGVPRPAIRRARVHVVVYDELHSATLFDFG